MKLRITWKRSVIGRPQNQRATIQALGLHKLNHTVVHTETPADPRDGEQGLASGRGRGNQRLKGCYDESR